MPIRYFTSIGQLSPAPFVEIMAFHAAGYQHPIQMMIDTGASRTTLPIQFLEKSLNALKIKSISCLNCDNQRKEYPLYVINLVIDGNTIPNQEVIGTHNQRFGLLGRDILQNYVLHYYGREQRFLLEYQVP